MTRSRLLLFVALLAAPLAVLDAASAAAAETETETDVCKLVTRKEASDLLGAKVVKTTTKTSATNGAEECTYRTKKVQKEFKDRNLRISLELTVQPMTDDLRSELQNIPFEDGSRVQGLGDEAYVTKFDQVIAVSGTTAVAAKLQNYRGASTKFRGVSEGAVKAALPRLAEITPPTVS
jgi:hypothetical protein